MLKGLEDVGRWSSKNGVWTKLATPMRELMEDIMPPDAHHRCNARRLQIAVCPVRLPFQTRMVTQFDSREHLIEICMASSFIPFYLQASPWLQSQATGGERLVDGGLIDIVPVMEGGLKTLKSCPYDIIRRIRSDRDDFVTAGKRWSLPQLLHWTLHPPGPEVLQELREAGRQSAEAWLGQQQPPPAVPRSS
jgi:hypothetical protein